MKQLLRIPDGATHIIASKGANVKFGFFDNGAEEEQAPKAKRRKQSQRGPVTQLECMDWNIKFVSLREEGMPTTMALCEVARQFEQNRETIRRHLTNAQCGHDRSAYDTHKWYNITTVPGAGG